VGIAHVARLLVSAIVFVKPFFVYIYIYSFAINDDRLLAFSVQRVLLPVVPLEKKKLRLSDAPVTHGHHTISVRSTKAVRLG